MKVFALLSLLMFIIFVSLVLPNQVAAYKLSQTRETVTVIVKALPDCNSGYRNKFIRISYEGEQFVFRTSCKFVAGLVSGQSIKMLHKADTDLFLFPEEDTITELIACIILTVFFALGGSYLFKKSG